MGDDSTKKVEFQITTVAELSGAKQLEASLERQIGQAKALGQDYSALSAQLEKVKAATANASVSHEELAHSAEHAELNHHALHKVFNLLGHESIPELGHALGGLLYGPAIGGALAVGFAFEFLEKKISESVERAAAKVQLAWETTHKAEEEAEAGATEFAEALFKASEPADDIRSSFESSKTLLTEMEAQHLKILQTIEDEQIAQADGDAAAIAAIKAKSAFAKEVYDRTIALRRLDLEQEELQQRNHVEAGLTQDAKNAQAVLDSIKRDPATIAAQSGMAESESKYGKDAVGNIKNQAEAAQKWLREQGFANSATAGDESFRRGDSAFTTDRVRAAAALVKGLEEYERNAATVAEHTKAVADATRAVKAAEAAAIKNQEAITQQTEKFKSDQGVFAQHNAGEDINKAIALSLRAGAGEKLNPSEELFIRTIATMTAGQNVTVSVGEKMFQAASKNKDILDSYLGRLLSVIEKTPSWGPLEERLRLLEQRFNTPPKRPTG